MAMHTHISGIILGIFFLAAGVMHFVATDQYVAMMPFFLPWHEGLVYLSGFLEIAGGIGVMFSSTRRFAGVGLIVLLIAVFPANVHVALHGLPIADTGVPIWSLWLRLPLQLVFLYWVAKVTLFDASFENFSASCDP